MAAELPRPGVEVIQVFRSVSPTVITPTLVPCVVGVCRQVVDALAATASGGTTLNNDAIVPLQALFIAKAAPGDPPRYAGLDGLDLVFSVNNAPDITVTFSGTLLSPSQVVAQIRAALTAAGSTTAIAELVGDTQWRLRTYASNEFQSIQVSGDSDGAVLAAFGVGARAFNGASFYSQDEIVVAPSAFPDPRSNLSQLAIEDDSIRLFFYMGGSAGTLSEIRRDQSFLRNGLATPAVAQGSAVLTSASYPGDFNGLVLNLTFNGSDTPLVVTFASPANAGEVLDQINAVINSVATATLDNSNYLVLTTIRTGPTASIDVAAGSGNTPSGLTVATTVGVTAVEAIDDGNGDTVTPLIRLVDATLLTEESEAVVTGTSSISGGVTDDLTLILDDGTGPQTLIFSGANNSTNTLAAINALFGAAAGGRVVATVNGSTYLVLTSTNTGMEARISVLGGTALSALGIEVTTEYGGAYPARAGDDLYIDGVFYSTISQVAPGGEEDVVKVARQVPISAAVGQSYYIIAKNLPGSGRPSGDLTVSTDGNVTIKNDLLRDTRGEVQANTRAQLVMAYRAVREDVTARATNPALLRFNDPVALASQLSPVNTDNPLALGLYFALLNASGTQVTGLGVDEASAAAPFGTVEAFTRAASFLEAYEVYAIAPMTHDATVGQIYSTHASVMSESTNKGERVVLFNPTQPTNRLDTLVASGIRGNSSGTSNVFDTGVANLGALLLGRDIDPTGAILVEEGLLLDVGDGYKYAIVSISGSLVTVQVSGFLSGENDDGYYATSTLPSDIIDGAFAVRIRGAALLLSDGSIDKETIAVTYQAMAQVYQNRRFWQVLPDQCAATLGGLEQIIDGFYMCAAVAGMIGRNPPQQSFTNFPMSGFTRVIGSNGYLTERQLDVAAAGGNYIIVQDEVNSPLISRMALTTDMTSIETRTDSITKVVDFCAKFLRRGLKNFIGRFNITQGFLDSLGHVIQGLLSFLGESGVLIGSHLNNIIQDQDAPDTVLVDITLDVPFPCNYIRLTLVI